VDPAWIAIIVTVVLALVAAFWWIFKTISEHAQRFATLETQVNRSTLDVKELRGDVRHECTKLRLSIDDNQAALTIWRHKINGPNISKLQLDVSKLKEKVEQLERWKSSRKN
jgi:hypothetical protein